MMVVRTSGFRFFAACERRYRRRKLWAVRIKVAAVYCGIIVVHAAVLLALQSLYWSLVS